MCLLYSSSAQNIYGITTTSYNNSIWYHWWPSQLMHLISLYRFLETLQKLRDWTVKSSREFACWLGTVTQTRTRTSLTSSCQSHPLDYSRHSFVSQFKMHVETASLIPIQISLEYPTERPNFTIPIHGFKIVEIVLNTSTQNCCTASYLHARHWFHTKYTSLIPN